MGFYHCIQILLENRELRQCLAEHQTVLEMVMGKFRRVSAHAARLERENSTMVGKNGLTELKVSFSYSFEIYFLNLTWIHLLLYRYKFKLSFDMRI